jgi:hypothetical protein
MQPDGKIKSVYCHFDGYPDHVGKMLFEFHNTEEKANQLVALGALSCLYEHLTPLPEAPAAHHYGDGKPPILTEHSYEHPQENVTVAYHRDRGEKYLQDTHESLDAFNKDGSFQSYNYLWMDGKWNIMDSDEKWIELTEEIVKEGLPEEN